MQFFGKQVWSSGVIPVLIRLLGIIQVGCIMKYKRVHFIKLGDEWIVFFCDTVRYKKISADEKECYDQILRGVSKEAMDTALCDRCRNDLIDNGEIAPIVPEEKVRLTLNVANLCNMKCGYCYANKGTYHSGEALMPLEVAKKAVDIFEGHFGAIGSIKFIGGEPLLNKETVCGVCDYVRDKYEAGRLSQMPDFIISTNGTILDERIAAYSVRYKWRVGISFDGPETVHDMVRTFRDDSSTVSVIKSNIQKWKEATDGKCPSSVNACFSGIHQQNGISVTDAVKYLKEELGIEKVNIIPIDASKDSSFRLIDHDCFVKAAKEILDISSKDYKKYMFTKLKKMEKMLIAHYSMPEYVCKAGLSTFGVSARGIVSPCHMLTDEDGFYMGTVDDDNIFESQCFVSVQNQLRKYNRYENEKCKSCFANRLCVGCLGGNHFRTGNPYEADPVVCSMIKGAVEEILRDLVR